LEERVDKELVEELVDKELVEELVQELVHYCSPQETFDESQTVPEDKSLEEVPNPADHPPDLVDHQLYDRIDYKPAHLDET
jgi:hypothetical protein